MRKVISAFALVMVLVVIGLMPNVAAQTAPYTVGEGDTIYALKGIYSSSQPEWKAFTILNPFLAEPGRAFVAQDGRFIVIIRPGETLNGVDQLGITVEPLPINQLKLPLAEEKEAEATATATAFSWSWLGWLPLAAFVTFLGYIAFRAIHRAVQEAHRERLRREEREERERQLAMDPVTSGTPYVPGGIQPNEPDRLETFFERQAIDGYARMNPTVDRATIRVERISPIVRGMLSNEGMVRYHDGQDPRPRRFNPPVPGYQARFRMPDGTEEILQSLQGCMNPVVYGGETLSGFTFTPVAEVVPIPTPAPAPTDMPTGPRAIPAIAARVSAEQTLVAMGSLKFLIPAGSIFRTGENGEILLTVGGPCDIRIRQRKKAAARPKAVQKTATAE